MASPRECGIRDNALLSLIPISLFALTASTNCDAISELRSNSEYDLLDHDIPLQPIRLFLPTYLPISLSNCAHDFHGRYSLNSRTMRGPAPGMLRMSSSVAVLRLTGMKQVLRQLAVASRADVLADLLVELRPRFPRPVLGELAHHALAGARHQQDLFWRARCSD